MNNDKFVIEEEGPFMTSGWVHPHNGYFAGHFPSATGTSGAAESTGRRTAQGS